MNSFAKTAEQKQLLSQIHRLDQDFLAREAELGADGAFPFANFSALKDIHYPLITWPKKFGGQGFSFYSYILAQEAIAQSSPETALSIGWHAGILLEYAESGHWKPEAADWLIPELVNGALVNTASTERDAGSPLRGAMLRTRAAFDGNELVVNGEKTYVSAAPALDYFFVTATNDEDQVITVIIPAKADGVTIEETWDMLAMKGTASQTLRMTNVRIPINHILKDRDSPPATKGWLLHIPACYIGLAYAARSYALGFAASYTPASLGEPIASTPAIQQIIGDMELELATARQLLYGTAECYEHAEDKFAMQEALDITKLAVTEAAISVVDKAMKIVGSRAMSESNPMHRYYLNVRAGLYNPPMGDMVKARLASRAIANFSLKETEE